MSRVANPMIDSCTPGKELRASLQRDDAADEGRDDDGERNGVDADGLHLRIVSGA